MSAVGSNFDVFNVLSGGLTTKLGLNFKRKASLKKIEKFSQLVRERYDNVKQNMKETSIIRDSLLHLMVKENETFPLGQ